MDFVRKTNNVCWTTYKKLYLQQNPHRGEWRVTLLLLILIFAKRLWLWLSSLVSCGQQFPTVDQFSPTGSSSVWSAKDRSHFVSWDDMWQAMTVKHLFTGLDKDMSWVSWDWKRNSLRMSGKLAWTLTVARLHRIHYRQGLVSQIFLWQGTDRAQT